MIREIEFLGYKSLKRVRLAMRPVRILIGPNAAGKSNVIDALRMLSEAVKDDVESAVNRRGGLSNLVFRNSRVKKFTIRLDYFVPDPNAPKSKSDMRYSLTVQEKGAAPGVSEEKLQIKANRGERGAPKTWFSVSWGKGQAVRDPEEKRREPFDTKDPGILALKALGFLDAYPRIRALRTFIESWRFLTVNLERVRELQRDERAKELSDDARNLANVLHTLKGTRIYSRILESLQSVLEHVSGLSTDLDRGRVLLLLKERAFRDPLEAVALSDGTLRLLAIFTALETMPEHSLLCIEEPEHGLHPFVLKQLLETVRERCPGEGTRQVLMTTHSPDLIDVAEPEEVTLVERDAEGATNLRELDMPQLNEWLKEFRLGELWKMRQIGAVP